MQLDCGEVQAKLGRSECVMRRRRVNTFAPIESFLRDFRFLDAAKH